MLPALLEDSTTELLELERLEGVEELDSLDELSIEEELDSLEELDSTEELMTSDELDSEEMASSEEELATSEATLEDETAASLPGLVIMLDATELLLDEITELITLEAALLEEDFEDDFDERALDELAVETGESELPPPPQALSTTVSEKAVKALNVYKLMFSILYLCCVMPHTRERNYC